jgi:hypothetical protein
MLGIQAVGLIIRQLLSTGTVKFKIRIQRPRSGKLFDYSSDGSTGYPDWPTICKQMLASRIAISARTFCRARQ